MNNFDQASRAMTNEHKTGQKDFDHLVRAIHDSNMAGEDQLLASKLFTSLTEQLAARDAEIGRLTKWGQVSTEQGQKAFHEIKRLEERERLLETRAERLEADLRAAHTVDDEKVERACAKAREWPALRQLCLGEALPHILTAALSPGQVGEETTKGDEALADMRERCATTADSMRAGTDIGKAIRALPLSNETALYVGMQNFDTQTIDGVEINPPPQSHDQACGGDLPDWLVADAEFTSSLERIAREVADIAKAPITGTVYGAMSEAVGLALTRRDQTSEGDESEWTQGICGDSACILRDGLPVEIEKVLEALTAPATLTDEELDEIERLAKAAQQTQWDGRFAGSSETIEADNALGFCFGPVNYPVCDLQKVSGYPRLGSGLVAVAFSREDQEHIAGCDPLTILTLVSMARRTAEAEEKLAVFETGIVPTQWFDDERVRAERAEATIAQLREQMATLREALERQSDNMAFVINNVDIHHWAQKFTDELEQDRAALGATTSEPR